jgi:hypothetical protein
MQGLAIQISKVEKISVAIFEPGSCKMNQIENFS